MTNSPRTALFKPRPLRSGASLLLIAMQLAACGDEAASTGDGDVGQNVDADVADSTADVADSADSSGDEDTTPSEDSTPEPDAESDAETPDTEDDSAVQTDAPDVAIDAADVDLSELEPFSFFVTSLAALQELSGSQQGFGGDLRFGLTGPTAGLRGADLICATIAERSMPGAGAKQWRAFLSATDDGFGNQVNAIDRIGDGPWYDRLGRLFANDVSELMGDRPSNADPEIRDDFPNEDGVPNHRPDPTQGEVDNHDMLTGTNEDGELYSATATCLDWTSAVGSGDGKPRVGHSWPRTGPGGGGGGPGGGGPGGDVNGENWMSALDESGCAPGINLLETGPPDPRSNTVGSGGGYGGFYCFSLTP